MPVASSETGSSRRARSRLGREEAEAEARSLDALPEMEGRRPEMRRPRHDLEAQAVRRGQDQAPELAAAMSLSLSCTVRRPRTAVAAIAAGRHTPEVVADRGAPQHPADGVELSAHAGSQPQSCLPAATLAVAARGA